MYGAALADSAVFITEKDAARLLSVSNRTLQAWRGREVGPPFIKLGRAIRYERDALIRWMGANTCVGKHKS